MPLKHFLAMGGFAFYVWTAYGVVAAVLIYNATVSITKRRRVIRDIKAWLKRR